MAIWRRQREEEGRGGMMMIIDSRGEGLEDDNEYRREEKSYEKLRVLE